MSARLRASVGLAAAQLRHYRVRTLLAVFAVTLAVLSTTLLASVGVGVLETGQQKLDAAERDLWITGGPVQLGTGGVTNQLADVHGLRAELGAREDVRVAVPIAFQTVYVGTDPDALEPMVGVGVPGGGPAVSVTDGAGFSGGDVHYADGRYDGPMTHEVLIDERTAATFDVGVGDTLYVGGSIANARENRFTVVGISPTFSRFLGTPTVTTHLSELQTLTGTAGTDRASLVTVTLAAGEDPEAVAEDLRREYPNYRVRTNQEQLRALVQEQVVVIAAAATLVVLAIVTGVALTANALAMLVFQQRRALAALSASGVSQGTLVAMTGAQAGLLGTAGGALGVGLTPVAALAVDLVAARVVGFSGLVQTPPWVYATGFAIAVAIGVVGGLVAGWRVTRIRPLEQLRGS